MHIAVGDTSTMPEFPSHATITVLTTDPNTLQSQVKKFQCEYRGCERSYTTVGNLRTHMKTHKGKLKFSQIELTLLSARLHFPKWETTCVRFASDFSEFVFTY